MKIEQHMSADPIHEVVAECRKFLKNEIRDHVLEADLKKDTKWVNRIWQKTCLSEILFWIYGPC